MATKNIGYCIVPFTYVTPEDSKRTTPDDSKCELPYHKMSDKGRTELIIGVSEAK